MEIFKGDKIFSFIDKHFELIKENTESIIKLVGTSDWTENEYTNFINVMKSENFTEQIDKHVLQIYSEDYLFELSGDTNIIKYSHNPSYINSNSNIYKYKVLAKDDYNELFNSKLLFLTKNKNPIAKDNVPANWKELRKFFKINKKITYTDTKTNINYVVNVCKCNKLEPYEADDNDLYYNLNYSKIIKSSYKYDFYIDITNASKDIILQAIIKMEQTLYLNPLIISKQQQVDIIKKYSDLVSKDIFKYNKYNKNPPLLTPKPVTLEKKYITEPDDYTNISILTEYTVTEKADGERLLMFIDNVGKVYLINNTYMVIDTGLEATKELYNSLIDGEYISCVHRIDNSSVGLFAAFDMYYYKGEKITNIPLIDNDINENTRFKYLKSTEKYIKQKSSNISIDYIVKDHRYSDNILKECDNILSGDKKFPYNIDGLIFTPAKLALYSHYGNKPVQITDNVKWDKVFKWKPPEQNTIDFLAKYGSVISIEGIKYREISLYVGCNPRQSENYTINNGLKEIYNNEYRKMMKEKNRGYILKLFKPNIYYEQGVEKSYIRLNSKLETRCENGDLIEGDKIVEYRYILDNTIHPSMRWIPMRIREDKTRIYNMGEISKTANDNSVAINIWTTIHNPVTESIIRGKAPVLKMDIDNDLLQSNDIYYSRNIPRDELLSYNMQQFHNIGIKNMLYSKQKYKDTLLELACGEGGDMNRWIDNSYKFVLGIDYVKNNIYNPRSGAYSRLLSTREKFFRDKNNIINKIIFPNIVYVAGDCGKSIMNGECSSSIDDPESVNILKIVLNKKTANVQEHYKKIAAKGAYGFDVCSCMFAIHYFFESEEKINTFLKNVSSMLKKGGTFMCTFMDGKSVIDAINNNGGDMIEGRKVLDKGKGIPLWSIIRKYDLDIDSDYNKKVDVLIEATKKFIPEFIVNFDVLIKKCKEYKLDLVDSELFSQQFNKIKSEIPSDDNDKTTLHKIIMKLDEEEELKKFSFFNRWCIFKKI